MTRAKKPQPMQCSLPFDYLKDVEGQTKYCDQCERTVYPVKTKAEFDKAMLDGKCVWFDIPLIVLAGGPPPEIGMRPEPKDKRFKLSKKPLVWKD